MLGQHSLLAQPWSVLADLVAFLDVVSLDRVAWIISQYVYYTIFFLGS
jgi:hypothetical protein